ncbi:opine metallophore biosynthesis dehydrogenase [Clostridium formicaceticum]|uniref:DUF2338 domain-containing protein n=1 Tax=Clostridium formicaceticum TaxID=1497 RepID=A0AAC9RPL2_9CLOT|nr:opine metallophore biosynthesis dehydrogenase [Clostridium formicaceticum]AOY74582.1 hypothetical protein BJL90_00600 [Clostridium formicaceticum]ARE88945.1 hypothetical protein CLFO_33510 [Clostridium formicaceticum]
MKVFQRVLILGTGPTTIQIAVNFKNKFDCIIGIAGRESANAKQFYQELYENKNKVRVHVQNEEHAFLSGECHIDYVFEGYETVQGEWDTIILAVTNDAYISVIRQLDSALMKGIACIVLVSPTIGSNSLVSNFLRKMNCSVEVISLSTYYAATKRTKEKHASVEVLTKGVKKKIYIGSTNKASEACRHLSELLHQLSITVELMKNPYEAESRNVSIYVHPPIFMNNFSLDVIFGNEKVVKYAYKFYPEGPITQYILRDLLKQWEEITKVLNCFNIERFNLLKFMNDDNYPVKTQSLSREDIENFTTFNTIKQEYLLYIRYTALLIDPFSTPDKEGKYFDFSAVPIQKAYQNQEGYWNVPRMPKEDYYRLKIIQGIAKHLALLTPIIDKFIHNYEWKLQQFLQEHKGCLFSDDFILKCLDDEIVMICNEINNMR